MAKDRSKMTTITLYNEDISRVELRGKNRSQTIARDLERLYSLYRRCLSQIKLTANEACLICDVLNGTIMDANSASMLWAEVEDGCNLDGLDEKWEIDGPALVEKLKSYNETQCLALVDAAERFWASDYESTTRETMAAFFSSKTT